MQRVLRRMILGVAAAFLAAAISGASAQSKPAGMGTWKLNLEKSKFNPGPAPKSQTVKLEPAGNGVKVTSEGVTADGKPFASEFTANYDGKDYPVKGSPVIDTVALVRIDALTNTRTDKKAGKVVATHKRVIAKDDKTWTVEIKGTSPKGEPFNNVLFFERQ